LLAHAILRQPPPLIDAFAVITLLRLLRRCHDFMPLMFTLIITRHYCFRHDMPPHAITPLLMLSLTCRR